MKALIFDASTLISFVMNGLFPELRELKKIFNGKFLITKEVKREIIDKPITIKRFELEALKLKQLLDDGVLEMVSSLNIREDIISKKTKEFLETANNMFIGNGRPIRMIDLGEASCLALSRILDEKKIEHVVAIDERTTRMLVEKPENLERLLNKKLHTQVVLKKENFKLFKGFKIIRSAELVYVIYKKKLAKLKDGQVLDAMLWAVKFKGCSISGDEIREIKRIG